MPCPFILFILTALAVIAVCLHSCERDLSGIVPIPIVIGIVVILWSACSWGEYMGQKPFATRILKVYTVGACQMAEIHPGCPINLTTSEGRIFGNEVTVDFYNNVVGGISFQSMQPYTIK
jgi:hypothetical protein